MELNALFLSLIAGLSTNLGLLFTYFKNTNKDKIISFSLSLASTIMILISIKELIPVSINFLYNYTNIYLFLSILIGIPLVCLFFIRLCKKYIKGENNLENIGILNALSLMLHNLPEGVIVFTSNMVNTTLGFKIFLSITLHNLPEGICVALPIYYSTNSRKKALIYTFISGIAEPFGAFLTFIFLRNFISDYFINISLYFVGILMLIISINEIIPEMLKYKEKLMILLGVLVGLIILII